MTEGKKETDLFFEKYEFIKEIEQLKAENAELVELLNKAKTDINDWLKNGYSKGTDLNQLLDEITETLEKHGK